MAAAAVWGHNDDVRHVPRKVFFNGGTKVHVFICDGVLMYRPKKGHDLSYRHPVPNRKVDPGEHERVAWAVARVLAASLGHHEEPDAGRGLVETPAATTDTHASGPNKWLIDTGSGFDLVGREEIPDWALDSMLTPRSTINLHTASGMTTVNEVVSLQVRGLMQEVTPLVLDSTPAVLSVGKRCMEQG